MAVSEGTESGKKEEEEEQEVERASESGKKKTKSESVAFTSGSLLSLTFFFSLSSLSPPMQTAMASQPLSLPTPRSSTPTAPRSAAGSLTQKSSVVPFVRPNSSSVNDEFGAGSANHASLPSSLRAARAARSLTASNQNSQNGGSSARMTPSSSLRRPTWRGSPAVAAVAPPAVRVSGFAETSSTTTTSAHLAHAPVASSGATGLLSRVLHVQEGPSSSSKVRERSLREQ